MRLMAGSTTASNRVVTEILTKNAIIDRHDWDGHVCWAPEGFGGKSYPSRSSTTCLMNLGTAMLRVAQTTSGSTR